MVENLATNIETEGSNPTTTWHKEKKGTGSSSKVVDNLATDP